MVPRHPHTDESPQSFASIDEDNGHLNLRYTKPSVDWSEALPIGNGRLGAMVHGRTTTELLQLNEDSVWYGGRQDRTPRDALRNLPLLRQLSMYLFAYPNFPSFPAKTFLRLPPSSPRHFKRRKTGVKLMKEL